MGKALAVLVTSLKLSEMSEMEKRRWERYLLELPVYVAWKDPSGGEAEELLGTTKDISSSGICVMCDSPILEGSEVDVKIDLPIVLEGMTGSRMSAHGTVVRNEAMTNPDEGYEHGIVFNRFYP
jgi:hypothetical protein